MALYSWFSQARTNQSNSSQCASKEQQKLTDNKYLESNTWWPVAVVIKGGQVTPLIMSEFTTNKDEKIPLITQKSASSQKTSLTRMLTVKTTNNTA